MSDDRETQLLDLSWLLSEGVYLADLLPGDFDGDCVICWIVEGLPLHVATRFELELLQRIKRERPGLLPARLGDSRKKEGERGMP